MIQHGQVIVFQSSTKWRIHFEASNQASKLIVVNITASWCGPYHQIQPSVTEFAEKYTDVDFIQIDADELHDVAQKFGVKDMPSFMLLLKRGKVVDKIVGAKGEDLQKKIEKHRF